MPSETILLAEDEAMVRFFVRSVLERHGYRLFVAEDGADALALVHQNLQGIDLVLTDVEMPYINGVELVERLRRIEPSLKVLYMTGNPTPHVKGLCSEGMVIEKPFGYMALLDAVETCLSEQVPVRAGA